MNTQERTEAGEQSALFEWAGWHMGRYPELRLLYHIPNGGKRDKLTGARLKAQGVKTGVPDLCLPVPRGLFHGLYIELKGARGRLQCSQKWWLEQLEAQGYKAAVCYGFEAARDLIVSYLGESL